MHGRRGKGAVLSLPNAWALQQLFSTVGRVVVTPTVTLFLFLPNCDLPTVMNCDVSICVS